MVKLIHEESSKTLKFDHIGKWYKPEPIPVDEIRKIILDIGKQTNHVIQTWRSGQILINKKEVTKWILLFQQIIEWK